MSNRIIFITNFRREVTTLLNAVGNLQELRQQYTWEDLGTATTTDDFTNDVHGDITKAKLVSAVSSVDAILTLLGQGHGTNLSYMKP